LAKYLGYKGWKHFLNENALKAEVVKVEKKAPSRLKYGLLPLAIILSYLLFTQFNTQAKSYSFCFINKTTGLPIQDSRLKLQLILENESPKSIVLTDNCFNGEGQYVEFTVEGNYYKPQTIKRNILNDNYHEEVMLLSDDYARVINLFSTSNVKDWGVRRNQLNDMMHDDAVIYHITKEGITIELYNKPEFIDQLTTPTRGLKSAEILETEYQDGKIISMKFTRA